jgi:hypothetical protein
MRFPQVDGEVEASVDAEIIGFLEVVLDTVICGRLEGLRGGGAVEQGGARIHAAAGMRADRVVVGPHDGELHVRRILGVHEALKALQAEAAVGEPVPS